MRAAPRRSSTAPAAEVTLRRPPPLGVELAWRATATRPRCSTAASVVAVGAPGDAGARRPARRSASSGGRGVGRASSGSTTIRSRPASAAGRERDPADALCLFCGPVGDGRFAVPWTPPAWTGDARRRPAVRVGGAATARAPRPCTARSPRRSCSGASPWRSRGRSQVGAPHVIQSWLEAIRRSQAPRPASRSTRRPASAARPGAPCGSSSRGRWRRDGGGPADHRDGPGRARAGGRDGRRDRRAVRHCRRPDVGAQPEVLGPPHGGFVVLVRGRRPVAGGGVQRQRRRRSPRSSACTSSPTRAGAALGQASCSTRSRRSRATSATRPRGSTPAAKQPARGACTSARATRPCRTTTTTRYAAFWGEKRL